MPQGRNEVYARALAVVLRAIRKKREISIKGLARRLDMSPSGIRGWEAGLSSPTWANLVDVTKVFHVKLSDMMLAVEKIITTLESQNETAKPATARANAKRKSVGPPSD